MHVHALSEIFPGKPVELIHEDIMSNVLIMVEYKTDQALCPCMAELNCTWGGEGEGGDMAEK